MTDKRTHSITDAIRRFFSEDPFYRDRAPADLASDFPLLESGILDSVGMLNLILFLESRFSIAIDISELSENNFATLERIELLVKAKQSKNDSPELR
jgi:acyl carrier protein